MVNTLIYFYHPLWKESKINKQLLDFAIQFSNVQIRNLSEIYGNQIYQLSNEQIKEEQAIILKTDRIILQYPTWWYNFPSQMEAFIEQVLHYGFGYTYEETNSKVHGKDFGIITSGECSSSFYPPNAKQQFDLVPLSIAKACEMNFIGSIRKFADDKLNEQFFQQYKKLLCD